MTYLGRPVIVRARHVLLVFAVAVAVGCTWGLPGPDAWCADSISPRSCGLFAIAETYRWGHYHVYAPLHMAVLTLVSLPWVALAAGRVGTGIGALGAELIKPLYMTGIESGARLVAAGMGLGIVWNTIRLWTSIASRRAGLAAGVVVALNSTLVYYAHTGNLEVPYLFWVTWALVELDRVARGEPREPVALVLATAAALTKQTAVAPLLLPLPAYLLLVPWLARRAHPLRRGVVRGSLLGLGIYAIVSGALVNPTGFQRHLAFTFGPGSRTWVDYPSGAAGALTFVREAFRATPHFTSGPVAAAAAVGVVLALRGTRGLERARIALPLLAGISFVLFLHLLARRTDDRFLLPASLFLTPYAAVSLDRAWARGSHWLVGVLAAVALAPAVLAVASMDATLLGDPRYAAERFLARSSPGTRVEVYGSALFLPRIPPQLSTSRPGLEPLEDRQPIAGIRDIVDPAMDPRPREPDLIVLGTELSTKDFADPAAPPHPFGLMQYRDPVSRAMFRGLLDGSLGFQRVLTATCTVPWPLECRSIHHSTAGEVWIYAPRADSARSGGAARN